MEEAKMPLQQFFNDFFKVAVRTKTYTNIFYLLLAFPLGIFYFVFFVTGLSMGAGLVVIFIGLPIIMFMFYMAKHLMAFERTLARSFLGMEIPHGDMWKMPSKGFWAKFKGTVFDIKAWKSMIYLLIKFPLGIFSFTAAVTLLATSLAMVTAPITYSVLFQSTGVDIFQNDIFAYLSPDYFTSLEKSLIYMILGAFLTFVSMHVLNFIAHFSGKLVDVMTKEWN